MTGQPAATWDLLPDGGKPGWQDRLLDDVWAAQDRRYPMTALQVSMPLEYRALLRAAADMRGMSTAAYTRRATSAFMVHDLGMAFVDLCAFNAHPTLITPSPNGRAGLPPGTPPRSRRDDGQDYGHWHACPGCTWEGYRVPADVPETTRGQTQDDPGEGSLA